MIRETIDDDPNIQFLLKSVPGFWHESWRDDVIERGIRSADGLAFVWDDNGEIVGFVCTHDLGFLGYLSILAVAEGARGRGIGTQLVRRAERELATRGCAVLISDVWKDAERFYRALGWTSPDVVLLRQRLLETGSQALRYREES